MSWTRLHLPHPGCQKKSSSSDSRIFDKMQIVSNALRGKRKRALCALCMHREPSAVSLLGMSAGTLGVWERCVWVLHLLLLIDESWSPSCPRLPGQGAQSSAGIGVHPLPARNTRCLGPFLSWNESMDRRQALGKKQHLKIG